MACPWCRHLKVQKRPVTGPPLEAKSVGYSFFPTGQVEAQMPFITVFCSTQTALVSDDNQSCKDFITSLLINSTVSWDAWPQGANDMTTNPDHAWYSAVQPKAYMMPVSPWFYTNLPEYNKNWLWRGDDMWHTRWQQVLEINPNFVEVTDRFICGFVAYLTTSWIDHKLERLW